jgi:hypothetical protein
MKMENGNGNHVRPSLARHVESDIWKSAPVLTGTTNFEPRPDMKNIMVTGGAGFMSVTLPYCGLQNKGKERTKRADTDS